MTPSDISNARSSLATLWGVNRPLHAAELGRALKFTGREPGRSVLDLEKGKRPISGPVSVALEALLSGWRPAHVKEMLREIRA